MRQLPDEVKVFVGRKRHRVNLRAVGSGKDLIVVVNGGDTPHIGAVAIGIPRPSLMDPEQVSSTVSVFSLTGHKDEIIARKVSERMTSNLDRVVVVVVGVHMEKASEPDIEELLSNSDKCVEKALRELTKNA